MNQIEMLSEYCVDKIQTEVNKNVKFSYGNFV